MPKKGSRDLMRLYQELLESFGPQGWWPGETRWEMMVGAILTQNTAWTNVEKAIANLKEAGKLTIKAMHRTPRTRIAVLVKPSGYYNQKAERLKALAAHIVNAHDRDLSALFDQDSENLRRELLAQKGIGPETADSIMLYAGDHLSFVIDAYTLRFARRYPLPFEYRYDQARDHFMENLPKDLNVYKEFHALFVMLAKHHCRTRPICDGCPIRTRCKWPAHR